jgi:hypothetical protein
MEIYPVDYLGTRYGLDTMTCVLEDEMERAYGLHPYHEVESRYVESVAPGPGDEAIIISHGGRTIEKIIQPIRLRRGYRRAAF